MGSFYQPKSYLKGGGSFYQPKSYLKGGMKKKNYTRRLTEGGYYPSVMSNLVRNAVYVVPFVMKAGYSLFSKIKKTRKIRK